MIPGVRRAEGVPFPAPGSADLTGVFARPAYRPKIGTNRYSFRVIS